MRNERAYAKLTKEVQFELLVFSRRDVPFFGDIEQQEVGAVVQVIIETVLRIEGDRRIDLPVIELAFDDHILVRKNIFRVIEIDLESPSFLFIQQEAQPVIVLRDRERLVEQAGIPARVIMRLDTYK